MRSSKIGDEGVILYLDTSSLVKLYVEEDRSDEVTGLVSTSAAAATSIIAYAESRAAFARRFKEGAFSKLAYRRLISSFDRDWTNFVLVMIFQGLIRDAGHFAELHELRGSDAIHLASALFLQEALGSPVTFSCFDRRLQHASDKEGLVQPQF